MTAHSNRSPTHSARNETSSAIGYSQGLPSPSSATSSYLFHSPSRQAATPGMEYDRKSAVSSFYGGRRSNAEALNADFPPPDGQAPRMRSDSASSFYNPNGPSRASAEILARPSAGYNSGSYFKAGRAEPVKGAYDEEEAAGLRDDGFDIFADFNNAGPRYSTAFGSNDTGCGQLLYVGRNKSNVLTQACSYRSVNSPAPKLVEDVGASGPVEMVTVPTLGPEWKTSELRELTGKVSKEERRERLAQKWKEWKRGERGLCGRYFTKKFLAWFIFALCVAYAAFFYLLFRTLINTCLQHRYCPRLHGSEGARVRV